MSIPFGEHEAGCTPLRPCRYCQALAFLRSKLDVADFVQFCTICGESPPEAIPTHYNRPISDFEWSARTMCGLDNLKIKTVGDLVRCTEIMLLRTPNFGRKSLNEVKQVLRHLDLSLAEPQS